MASEAEGTSKRQGRAVHPLAGWRLPVSCRDTVRRSGSWTSPEDMQGENAPPSGPQREERRGNSSAPLASVSCLPRWHFVQVQKWRDNWTRMRHQPRDREGGSRVNLRRRTRFVSTTLHTLRYSGLLVPSHSTSSPTATCHLHSPERTKTPVQVPVSDKSPDGQLGSPGRLKQGGCETSSCSAAVAGPDAVADTHHLPPFPPALALQLVGDVCLEGSEFLVALPLNSHSQM